MKKKHYFGRGAMFVLCAIFAIAFLLPTVLTITNSFMSEEEINANYGMIFSTTTGGYVFKRYRISIPLKQQLHHHCSNALVPVEEGMICSKAISDSCYLVNILRE